MKVRRNEWPAGVYGVLQEGMLCIKKEDGLHSWLVSETDMYAEDFETTL